MVSNRTLVLRDGFLLGADREGKCALHCKVSIDLKAGSNQIYKTTNSAGTSLIDLNLGLDEGTQFTERGLKCLISESI